MCGECEFWKLFPMWGRCYSGDHFVLGFRVKCTLAYFWGMGFIFEIKILTFFLLFSVEKNSVRFKYVCRSLKNDFNVNIRLYPCYEIILF